MELFDLKREKPEQAAAAVVKDIQIYVPLKDLIDLDKEISRLEKEVGNMDKELERLKGKLNNQDFLAKAPAHVVEKERAKAAEYQEKKQAVLDRLAMIKG